MALHYPQAPVLLITFNRPQYTRHVIESIKRSRVNRLYVFNDGPRDDNPADENCRSEIKKNG